MQQSIKTYETKVETDTEIISDTEIILGLHVAQCGLAPHLLSRSPKGFQPQTWRICEFNSTNIIPALLRVLIKAWIPLSPLFSWCHHLAQQKPAHDKLNV